MPCLDTDASPYLAILYAAGQVVVALRRAQTGYDDYELGSGKAPTGKVMTLLLSYSRLYVEPLTTHLNRPC